MTRVRLTAAAVSIAAALLATTALTTASAATPVAPQQTERSQVASAHPHTRLHLHITGCARCTVTLQRAITGGASVWTSGTKRIGSDDVVTFRVRSARTHGLSFELHAPWEKDPVAVPNMVTRYAGHRVDSSVSRTAARHATQAEGCWAGTHLRAVTLGFHVSHVWGENGSGQQTRVPLVYATHTMSSWEPIVTTFKGTIGNQDAFYCTEPPTTTLTFQAPGCNGCRVQVYNGARRAENVWVARTRQVRKETVSFAVPTPLTRGLSAIVRAPWEGSPPFTTAVVWRYGGHDVGDPVSFNDARAQSRASGCWAGTADAAMTVALTVRQITVKDNAGQPTAASIAFTHLTQPWLRPMTDVKKGVLGIQDLLVCRK